MVRTYLDDSKTSATQRSPTAIDMNDNTLYSQAISNPWISKTFDNKPCKDPMKYYKYQPLLSHLQQADLISELGLQSRNSDHFNYYLMPFLSLHHSSHTPNFIVPASKYSSKFFSTQQHKKSQSNTEGNTTKPPMLQIAASNFQLFPDSLASLHTVI